MGNNLLFRIALGTTIGLGVLGIGYTLYDSEYRDDARKNVFDGGKSNRKLNRKTKRKRS